MHCAVFYIPHRNGGILSLLFVWTHFFRHCRTNLAEILHRDGGLSQTLSRNLVTIAPGVPLGEPKMWGFLRSTIVGSHIILYSSLDGSAIALIRWVDSSFTKTGSMLKP